MLDYIIQDHPADLLKAQNLGPGERWVTVHSSPGAKGTPLLIREHPDGTATVIGGAGGSMTGLRLNSKKSGESDKGAITRRQEDRKKAKADQTASDKADGTHEAKSAARKAVSDQKRVGERQFIEAVAKARGWHPDSLKPASADLDGLTPKQQEAITLQHHREMLAAANTEAGASMQRAKLDHVAREAEIGELPLSSDDPDTMSVADLDPMKEGGGGLGFAADYKKRSQDAGTTPDDVKHELDAIKHKQLADMTPEQRAHAVAKDAAGLLAKESAAIRNTPLFDPKGAAKQADMKSDIDILMARKKMQLLARKAATANKDIDAAKGEPKAFSLVADDDETVSAAVQDEIIADLRTAAARSFLTKIDEHGRESMGKHIASGAFNSINALSMTVTGEGMIDRSVVDVLGIAGAAKVIARRMRSSLSPDEYENLHTALSEHHAETYAQSTKQAMEQADDWQKIAADIVLPQTAVTGDDFEHAQTLNGKRREAIGKAKQTLATVLGETEANAAMVAALNEPAAESVDIPMGAMNAESAIHQARALGLKQGDYSLEKVGKELVLTVNASGMDAIAKPFDRNDLAQLKTSQSIINGDQDEDGWMPIGFASRPDLAMDTKAGISPRLARPFDHPQGGDLEASIKSYIGGRMADGDAPADILADVQSADFITKSGGDAKAYGEALGKVAPLRDDAGKQRRADDFAPIFDAYADEFVEKEFGGTRSTLNKQTFDVDKVAGEAMHRALSAHPDGVVAYKQIGELTAKDQTALRNYFGKNVAKESPDEAGMRADLDKLDANEPEQSTVDMFGDTTTNPEWSDWKSQRTALAEKVSAASLSWQKYIGSMHGNAKAYESIQDMIRSDVSATFADAYNKLRPDAPLKLGRSTIRNNLNHLDAVDPKAREERQGKELALRDALRERVAGKYASGSVSDKLDAYKEQKQAFEQSQMGFFSSDDDMFGGGGNQTEPAPAKLRADERSTIGHAAESKLASMAATMGANFKPGDPVKLWNPSMSGKYVAQQRAIKLLVENKRLGGALAAGSGKTAIMLGGFSHLHGMGKVKRALMVVPSIVQGQFAGEALRYLEPGKFKWHIEPGASRDERLAAYKDPSNHFCVMTHQSFRDDMIHIGSNHAGVDEAAMTQQVNAMSPDERQGWMKGVMEKEGMNFDASFVDEAHETLNRDGKANSTLANVSDALSDNTPYYGYFSGDPVKNDASEIHSVLSKLDRKRYGDRASFMRKYGVDTISAKDGLRREMSRYVFPNKIGSGVDASHKVERVELSGGQKTALADMQKHIASARLARMSGKVDIKAMQAISPSSFEGVAESDHEGIAKGLQSSLGIMRSSAINRIINSHPDNAKMDRMEQLIDARPGKQGVIFARNRESVAAIQKRLEAKGKRVVVITGSDSAKEKDRKRKMFNPESGEPEADILLASDAAAVGMNLQSGKYLIQHDTPLTAKTHGQRNARIDRLGQKSNVELIDMVANHPEEDKARDRLSKKYDLKDLMASPMEGLDDSGLAYRLKQLQVGHQNGDAQAGLF